MSDAPPVPKIPSPADRPVLRLLQGGREEAPGLPVAVPAAIDLPALVRAVAAHDRWVTGGGAR